MLWKWQQSTENLLHIVKHISQSLPKSPQIFWIAVWTYSRKNVTHIWFVLHIFIMTLHSTHSFTWLMLIFMGSSFLCTCSNFFKWYNSRAHWHYGDRCMLQKYHILIFVVLLVGCSLARHLNWEDFTITHKTLKWDLTKQWHRLTLCSRVLSCTKYYWLAKYTLQYQLSVSYTHLTLPTNREV